MIYGMMKMNRLDEISTILGVMPCEVVLYLRAIGLHIDVLKLPDDFFDELCQDLALYV